MLVLPHGRDWIILQEAGPRDVEGRQNTHVEFADAPNPCRVRPCNDSGTGAPGLFVDMNTASSQMRWILLVDTEVSRRTAQCHSYLTAPNINSGSVDQEKSRIISCSRRSAEAGLWMFPLVIAEAQLAVQCTCLREMRS